MVINEKRRSFDEGRMQMTKTFPDVQYYPVRVEAYKIGNFDRLRLSQEPNDVVLLTRETLHAIAAAFPLPKVRKVRK